jgi:hypothetical protein
MAWFRSLTLFLALAMMPIYGIAATASLLLCYTDGAEQTLHVAHMENSKGDDANRGAPHGHESDNNPGSQAAGHYCFHHFAYALPALVMPSPNAGFLMQASFHTLNDLFVPDRPQRPPLA